MKDRIFIVQSISHTFDGDEQLGLAIHKTKEVASISYENFIEQSVKYLVNERGWSEDEINKSVSDDMTVCKVESDDGIEYVEIGITESILLE